jgi:hypothetical protein
MGDLVLNNVKEGKWDRALLAKLLLTGKLINENFFEINIPTFPGPDLACRAGVHGHHFGNPTATEKFSRQLAPGQAIILPPGRHKARTQA